MNDAEILSAIELVARRHLAFAGRLSAGQRLIEDLALDSLRLLTLAAEVENHFRIRLEPADEATIATVGDLVRRVAEKLEADGR